MCFGERLEVRFPGESNLRIKVYKTERLNEVFPEHYTWENCFLTKERCNTSHFPTVAPKPVFTGQLCPTAPRAKLDKRAPRREGPALTLPLFHCILEYLGDPEDHPGQEYPAINKMNK